MRKCIQYLRAAYGHGLEVYASMTGEEGSLKYGEIDHDWNGVPFLNIEDQFRALMWQEGVSEEEVKTEIMSSGFLSQISQGYSLFDNEGYVGAVDRTFKPFDLDDDEEAYSDDLPF